MASEKRTPLGDIVLSYMRERFTVTEKDIGRDAHLNKSVMHFTVRSFDAEGFGHFCILNLNAMLGLMKMETVVLSPMERDMPLFNMDWVKTAGTETQLIEIYDAHLLEPPVYREEPFTALRDRDADIPDNPREARWYDSILLPGSQAKSGKGFTARFQSSARAYAETYLQQFAEAPACDPAEKAAKNKAYADRLLSEGGVAVDQMTKLFGRATAKRLVLTHMYGVD